jgi:hypothetical protein
MTKDLPKIEAFLRQLLVKQTPLLRLRKNEATVLEACGTKEAMQGKQKVDGHYFASVMPKPKDIRLYFLPIYSEPDAFTLSPALQKMLKGKSCFHIKQLDDALKEELELMVTLALKIYKDKDLI